MACLIATLGTEPQVVTLALHHLQNKGIEISTVHVVHTHSSSARIKQALTDLNAAFQLPTYQHVTLAFCPITHNGTPVTDVDTDFGVIGTINTIYDCLQAEKRAGQHVHLCVAGGRKTMSLYGMLAAQMLFDAHDKLWHLISNGSLLAERRFDLQPGDNSHLVELPVMALQVLAPDLFNFAPSTPPLETFAQIHALQVQRHISKGAKFVEQKLTPSQWRVVKTLLAHKETDQALALRLKLSPKTIESHLREAYAKANEHWEITTVRREVLVALLQPYFDAQHLQGIS